MPTHIAIMVSLVAPIGSLLADYFYWRRFWYAEGDKNRFMTDQLNKSRLKILRL